MEVGKGGGEKKCAYFISIHWFSDCRANEKERLKGTLRKGRACFFLDVVRICMYLSVVFICFNFQICVNF